MRIDKDRVNKNALDYGDGVSIFHKNCYSHLVNIELLYIISILRRFHVNNGYRIKTLF